MMVGRTGNLDFVSDGLCCEVDDLKMRLDELEEEVRWHRRLTAIVAVVFVLFVVVSNVVRAVA